MRHGPEKAAAAAQRGRADAPAAEALDLREKGGPKDGAPQALDRRLFMQLTAFGNCKDPAEAIRTLVLSGVEGALYADVNDPRGVALLALSETPELFVGEARALLNKAPFASMTVKPEYAMLGRTYSLGYEPDLADWLLLRPRRTVLNPAWPWAVWYPLRRTGAFNALPPDAQRPILREHGQVGHAFGSADHAHDVRLACHGLDKNDNEFVIGLVGKELHPLSALVQAMRRTEQTSKYIDSMGPFFVGKAIWQSAAPPEAR